MYFAHLSEPREIVDTIGRKRSMPGCGKSTFAIARAAIRHEHRKLPKDHEALAIDLRAPEIMEFIRGNEVDRH
ncbi:MAG: hypothetical protein ACR2NU_11265 [Aeoliella sp.]